jgi:hypothetical protein
MGEKALSGHPSALGKDLIFHVFAAHWFFHCHLLNENTTGKGRSQKGFEGGLEPGYIYLDTFAGLDIL